MRLAVKELQRPAVNLSDGEGPHTVASLVGGGESCLHVPDAVVGEDGVPPKVRVPEHMHVRPERLHASSQRHGAHGFHEVWVAQVTLLRAELDAGQKVRKGDERLIARALLSRVAAPRQQRRVRLRLPRRRAQHERIEPINVFRELLGAALEARREAARAPVGHGSLNGGETQRRNVGLAVEARVVKGD